MAFLLIFITVMFATTSVLIFNTFFLNDDSKNKKKNEIKLYKDEPQVATTIKIIPSGYSIVSIADATRFTQGAIIDEHTMDLITYALFKGERSILIETEKLQRFEAKLKEYLDMEEIENQVYRLKAEARNLEKSNNIAQSIETYMEIVELCLKNEITIKRYLSDIQRILILYRKTGQLDKESEYIKYILSKLPDYGKWNEMLAKSQAKIAKKGI